MPEFTDVWSPGSDKVVPGFEVRQVVRAWLVERGFTADDFEPGPKARLTVEPPLFYHRASVFQMEVFLYREHVHAHVGSCHTSREGLGYDDPRFFEELGKLIMLSDTGNA